MNTKRNEKTHYEWSNGKLRSIWTKTIDSVKTKEEVEKEIDAYKNMVEYGKNRIKSIKQEKKKMKQEKERILKDIDSCNKRVEELTKKLKNWPNPEQGAG